MPKVVEQEKELRFTRSAQAAVFWLVGAVASMSAITFVVVGSMRHENPALPHPAWALIPLAVAIGAIRLAVHLNRHAYLILTPLGIDVFPFFRPAKNMRTIFWQEIKAMDSDEEQRMLVLHFDDERTSGVYLSLRPMEKSQRKLFLRALKGRVEGASESPTSTSES